MEHPGGVSLSSDIAVRLVVYVSLCIPRALHRDGNERRRACAHLQDQHLHRAILYLGTDCFIWQLNWKIWSAGPKTLGNLVLYRTKFPLGPNFRPDQNSCDRSLCVFSCVIGMSYTLHSKCLFSYCTSLVSILEVLSQQGK